jgi:Family of unknown function (DUF6356)
MDVNRLFTEHPESVGETYFQHLVAAGGFGLRMVLGGLACLLHGVLPFLFERTGSNCVTDLHQRMVARQRRPQSQVAAVGQRPIGRRAAIR